MNDHTQPAVTLGGVLLGAMAGAAGHPLLQAVVAVAFLDLATGLTKAWIAGDVESNRLGKGLFKILAYLGVCACLVLIGRVSPESLIAANALAGMFLLREMLSNVENLHDIGNRLGVKIPGVDFLAKIMKLRVAKILADEAKEGGAQ